MQQHDNYQPHPEHARANARGITDNISTHHTGLVVFIFHAQKLHE